MAVYTATIRYSNAGESTDMALTITAGYTLKGLP